MELLAELSESKNCKNMVANSSEVRGKKDE